MKKLILMSLLPLSFSVMAMDDTLRRVEEVDSLNEQLRDESGDKQLLCLNNPAMEIPLSIGFADCCCSLSSSAESISKHGSRRKCLIDHLEEKKVAFDPLKIKAVISPLHGIHRTYVAMLGIILDDLRSATDENFDDKWSLWTKYADDWCEKLSLWNL